MTMKEKKFGFGDWGKSYGDRDHEGKVVATVVIHDHEGKVAPPPTNLSDQVSREPPINSILEIEAKAMEIMIRDREGNVGSQIILSTILAIKNNNHTQ